MPLFGEDAAFALFPQVGYAAPPDVIRLHARIAAYQSPETKRDPRARLQHNP